LGGAGEEEEWGEEVEVEVDDESALIVDDMVCMRKF
jgi:hypothetical protein